MEDSSLLRVSTIHDDSDDTDTQHTPEKKIKINIDKHGSKEGKDSIQSRKSRPSLLDSLPEFECTFLGIFDLNSNVLKML